MPSLWLDGKHSDITFWSLPVTAVSHAGVLLCWLYDAGRLLIVRRHAK